MEKVSAIVDDFSSSGKYQLVGKKNLQELVKESGIKLVHDVLPHLQVYQNCKDVLKKVAATHVFIEIINCISKDVFHHCISSIIPMVRQAIADNELAVRKVAANLFSALYKKYGYMALQEVILPLWTTLVPYPNNIQSGLHEIMKVNGREVLPFLLERASPPFMVDVLCSLAIVDRKTFNCHLLKLLDVLITNVENNTGEEDAFFYCCKAFFSTVDEYSAPLLIQYLLKRAANGNRSACTLLSLCPGCINFDHLEMVDQLLNGFLRLYTSDNIEIVQCAISTSHQIIENLQYEQKILLMPSINYTIKLLQRKSEEKIPVNGFQRRFSLEKIVQLLMEIISKEAIKHKELAIETLNDVISIAGFEAFSELNDPSIKLKLIDLSIKFLEKIFEIFGVLIHSLDSVYITSLKNESSRQVRLAAGEALAHFITRHHDPDSIILELLYSIACCKDLVYLETSFIALKSLLVAAVEKLTSRTIMKGIKISEKVFLQFVNSSTDFKFSSLAATLYGEIAIRTKSSENIESIVSTVELSINNRFRLAHMIALEQISNIDPTTLLKISPYTFYALSSAFLSEDVAIVCSAINAATSMLISQADSPNISLLIAISRNVNNIHFSVKFTAFFALGQIFLSLTPHIEYLKILVPLLLNENENQDQIVRSAVHLILLLAFNLLSDEHLYKAYYDTLDNIEKAHFDESFPNLSYIKQPNNKEESN